MDDELKIKLAIDLPLNLAKIACKSPQRMPAWDMYEEELKSEGVDSMDTLEEYLNWIPPLQMINLSALDDSINSPQSPQNPLRWLRWITSCNQTLVKKIHLLDQLSCMGTQHQYVIAYNADKENLFQEAKLRHGGSAFAWHGSPSPNWYGILRRGLLKLSGTQYQVHGVNDEYGNFLHVYGKGIYLSPVFHTAAYYSNLLEEEKSGSNTTIGPVSIGMNIQAVGPIYQPIGPNNLGLGYPAIGPGSSDLFNHPYGSSSIALYNQPMGPNSSDFHNQQVGSVDFYDNNGRPYSNDLHNQIIRLNSTDFNNQQIHAMNVYNQPVAHHSNDFYNHQVGHCSIEFHHHPVKPDTSGWYKFPASKEEFDWICAPNPSGFYNQPIMQIPASTPGSNVVYQNHLPVPYSDNLCIQQRNVLPTPLPPPQYEYTSNAQTHLCLPKAPYKSDPSLSYQNAPGEFIRSSNLKCIALCEVIESNALDKFDDNGKHQWVVRDHNHVMPRFLFVYEDCEPFSHRIDAQSSQNWELLHRLMDVTGINQVINRRQEEFRRAKWANWVC